MSVLSSILSAGKTVIGFASPAGAALKLAPWALAGALGVALYVEHVRLVAADAGITTAQAQTRAAVSDGNARIASTNAAANAGVVAIQTAGQEADAPNEVQVSLSAQHGQAAQQEAAQALGQALNDISTQAAQPKQDGPISPPVLEREFQ